MSAFMLSQSRFQTLADALGDQLERSYSYTLAGHLRPDDKREARTIAVDIARDWHKANVRAIDGRYGKSGADMGVDSIVIRKGRGYCIGVKLSKVALVKLLQCLRYQCSEDVAPEYAQEHEKAMAEIDSAIRILCESIVRNLPEYDGADCG